MDDLYERYKVKRIALETQFQKELNKIWASTFIAFVIIMAFIILTIIAIVPK